MKHLIQLLREWYSYHLYVIDLEKSLAKWPDSEQNKYDLDFYTYLEESTAQQIIDYFKWPLERCFRWVGDLFKKQVTVNLNDIDNLPF
jgi:hypothetical protein